VRVELAGVRSEELRVTVDGEELRIRGERRPAEPAGVRLHRMEIASSLRAAVRVPILFARRGRRTRRGFLTVTLPRRLPARVRAGDGRAR
jgi:HSP20 family molecular chaperone IbpA